MSLLERALLLLLLGACQGRGRHVLPAEEDALQGQVFVDGIADPNQLEGSVTLDNPVPAGGDPELQYTSADYNEWVDHLLEPFATALRVETREGAALTLSTSRKAVRKLQSKGVTTALQGLLTAQCGGTGGHVAAQLLHTKNTCLAALYRDLKGVLGSSARTDLTVRDQVVTGVICRVLPPTLACFEPTLSQVVGCTGDGGALTQATGALRTLLGSYCADEGRLMQEGLSAAPANCIPQGVNFYLKYTGPSFLQSLTAVQAQHFPCVYSQYLVSVADVVLRLFCGADALVDHLRRVAEDFGERAGCGGL